MTPSFGGAIVAGRYRSGVAPNQKFKLFHRRQGKFRLIKVKARSRLCVILRRSIRETCMSLPHAFKRIRLHLARSKDFPSGSSRHGYELVAPLDAQGHIDAVLWKAHRDRCRVRRFWGSEGDQLGVLTHKPGGDEHARWIFDYDQSRVDDDEVGYRFGAHRFAAGEYLTLRDQDVDHTFRIVSVENAA
jgi:hypothetical protein